MEVSGVIKSVPVEVGDEITGAVILATIYDSAYQKAFDQAEAAFKDAEKNDVDAASEKADLLLQAKADLDACTLRNTDVEITLHGLDGVLHGIILERLVYPSSTVNAGDPILLVRPPDTFYAFNQTLAVLTFLGFIVSLIFHRMASQ